MIKLEWIEMNPLKASNWTTKATEFDKLAHAGGSTLAAMILSPIFGLIPGCVYAFLLGGIVELVGDNKPEYTASGISAQPRGIKIEDWTSSCKAIVSVTDLAANFAGVLSFFLSVKILLLRGG